jgi:hypothetical protein
MKSTILKLLITQFSSDLLFYPLCDYYTIKNNNHLNDSQLAVANLSY